MLILEEEEAPRLSVLPDIELVPPEILKLQSERTPGHKSIRQSNIRWLILFLSCLALFGIFFCMGNPQALQAPIEDKFDILDSTYNFLHNACSLPNIIIPFFAGAVMDFVGTRIIMIVLAFFVLIGQIMATMGGVFYSFQLLWIGRFVMGVGEATLELGLLTIIARWFLNKEITLAWGIARMVLRLGSAVNSYLTPKLYAWTGLIHFPLLVGIGLIMISVACIFVVIYYDARAEQEEGESQGKFIEKVNFSEIKQLSNSYFYVMITAILVYMSFIGFTNTINNFLVRRFGFSSVKAGELISLVYLIAGGLSPFIGLIVDRVGKRILFLLASVVLLFIVHVFFAFLPDGTIEHPNYKVLIGLIGLGIFYAVFATNCWPCIPLLVNSKVLGTACGFMSGAISFGITVNMGVLGFIHDLSLGSHNGYFWTQVNQCILVMCAFAAVTLAYFEDKKRGGLLRSVALQPKQGRFM